MKLCIEIIRANCDEVGDCWLWRGACDHKAPVMRPEGERRLIPVRRAVLDMQGKLKPTCLATAGCREDRCVNPEHIKQLTRAQLQTQTAREWQVGDNLARSAKISAKSRKHGKLTVEIVEEMRASGLTSREAARKYGCSQSSANDAMAGRTWKDYTNPWMRLAA